jgi:ribosomal protein S18 acetylase RimI-like enzyme
MLDLFVAAFANDPFYRWMQPDDDAWPAFARAWFGFATDLFLRGDMATITEHAVAIWVPPGPGLVTADDVVTAQRVLAEHLGDRGDEVFAAINASRGHEPDEPHTTLQYLAVAPSHQGRGLGGELVRAVLDDLEGPAFLVSTNPANLGFYARHGFEVTATIEGAAPTTHAMTRPAT